jgi:hypothetical protein
MSVSIVKYDLARSRNHAFNILVKKGLVEVERGWVLGEHAEEI